MNVKVSFIGIACFGLAALPGNARSPSQAQLVQVHPLTSEEMSREIVGHFIDTGFVWGDYTLYSAGAFLEMGDPASLVGCYKTIGNAIALSYGDRSSAVRQIRFYKGRNGQLFMIDRGDKMISIKVTPLAPRQESEPGKPNCSSGVSQFE